jgi:hypothetical protein
MMIPDRSSKKVTIEDLLRLKRAERPSAEFWTRFEQDLRAKQLAAIVEKRPWWHFLHLPQAARALSRHQVPVGAAAILALSFIVVGQYSKPVATPSIGVVSERVVQSHVEAIQPSSFEKVVQVDSTPTALAQTSTPQVESVVAPQPTALANSNAVSSRPAELTAMIPWGVVQTEENASADRLLTTSLQVDTTSGSSVASLLGNVRSDENRIEAKPSVAQASSPRELRRAKILTGMVLADNAEGSDYAHAIHGREIAANDLSEAQLYDSVQRLGVGGDRFTLKF